MVPRMWFLLWWQGKDEASDDTGEPNRVKDGVFLKMVENLWLPHKINYFL